MKIIYRPAGKAGEYSPWAANFYNGCIHNCEYCYCNNGLLAGTIGGTNVRLKKSLVDEATAYETFCKELEKCKDDIIKDGALHFNFVSDPCLPLTIDLNWKCIAYALSQGVPVQVLTKRADWLDHPAVQDALSNPDLLKVGFTLTGCDDIEPGASPNLDRIKTMRILHDAGIFTWASCEPIIDPKRTLKMIQKSLDYCDHYKIGILSGKKSYSPQDIRDFVTAVNALNPKNVVWKKSLLEFVQKP